MNILNQLFGGGIGHVLEGILGHATADMLQPVLRKQLHRNTSDAERALLSKQARAFADALDAKKDDEAATALAAVIGSLKPAP